MGFFSKVFKGIKKTFKKIGRGIKKVASKVGKFVGKLGIVGQIGLMFILPGIGGALGSAFNGLTGFLSATQNPILKGLGTVLKHAGSFASKAGNVFKTVTEGVTKFVTEVGRGAFNQVTGGAFKSVIGGPETIGAGWNAYTESVVQNFQSIAGKGVGAVSKVDADVLEGINPDSITESVGNITAPRVEPIQVGEGSIFPEAFNPTSVDYTKLDPYSLVDEIIGNPQQAADSWFKETFDTGVDYLKGATKDAGKKVIGSAITTGITDLVMGDENYEEYASRVSPVFSTPGYEALQTAYGNQLARSDNYGANALNMAEIYSGVYNSQDPNAAFRAGFSGGVA